MSETEVKENKESFTLVYYVLCDGQRVFVVLIFIKVVKT